MGAGSRWLVAVAASLACFGGCWGGLADGRVLDTGSQVGVASVPLVVGLAVLGAWAERAREKKLGAAEPGEDVRASAEGSPQSQVTGQVSGGLVIGPGAVFNLGGQEADGKEPLRVGASGGVLVVGDVPQEPAAFQLRAGLMDALAGGPGARVSVVFAVTGARGVGKTQVAAAYARRRIADGWRLVAWVDAADEALVLTGLAQVATAAGLGAVDEDARVLAAGVRHWLEADGERRLVVFDNAVDLDGLRPFLPAAGAAQVVITSTRRSAAGLGRPVPVDVFSEAEALAFLAERTGRDDEAGALKMARELGFLPLGLAQAAALIARDHLGYGVYLERLRALPVAGYLQPAEGDAYRYRAAEAIVLSLAAVEGGDTTGRCAMLMGVVAVLAETGISRRLLHLAASCGALGEGPVTAGDADAAAGQLADASLLGFTLEDSLVAHRLVMRVVRERLAAEGQLADAVVGAVLALRQLADGIDGAWRDPAGVRELSAHLAALAAHDQRLLDTVGDEITGDLLQVRLRSVYLLNELGDSTGLAIVAGEALAADCERVLGTDHPDTLMSRNNLAVAYQGAGRTAEAIPVLEQTLADRERVLGTDHPNTLASRNNLAMAYRAAGRTTEAIPLYEQTLADCERVLGTDHPNTLTSRNNLAMAYQVAGRTAEAISLYEQTLADRERVLGTDHPNTLASRNNLAAAYEDAGRTAEAISLYEQTHIDYERVLGTDHPNTLTSRNNLAMAYLGADRTAEAIPVLEQTLADCERVLGTDHPDTLTSRNNLAMAYRAAGRTAEAISLYEQTLADCERVLGTDHPDTLTSRNNLAMAYRAAGRTAEAISLYEQTLADCERVLGTDHPNTLDIPQQPRHGLPGSGPHRRGHPAA